jgi:hypothetical protein
MVPTYPEDDLVRQRLCSPLPLSEIGPRSVQLRSIQLLVITSLDAIELLIECELIPSRKSRGTSTGCDVVSVTSPGRPSGSACSYGQVNSSSPKLAFAALRLLADISVRLECYKRRAKREKRFIRSWLHLQSLFVTLASTGTDDQVTISGAAIKS